MRHATGRRRGDATADTRDARRIEERLARVQDDLKRARSNVRVLTEQVAHLAEVADEAETRAVVAETPLADREYRLAVVDRENHARLLDEARDEVRGLERTRDDLLDRLLDLEARGG